MVEETTSELEIRKKKLELELRKVALPIELATYGLRGTLFGTFAGLFAIVVLAGISAFSERIQITGTQLCIMTAIIAVTVALYGAFVFQRSLSIAGQWGEKGISVRTAEKAVAKKIGKRKRAARRQRSLRRARGR
jgi:hypothetical protein